MADQTTNAIDVGTEAKGYWATNIRIIKWCLVVWALCSFGFGIVFRPLISGIKVGGADLGFWFAQQGSILVFLALIFFYAWISLHLTFSLWARPLRFTSGSLCGPEPGQHRNSTLPVGAFIRAQTAWQRRRTGCRRLRLSQWLASLLLPAMTTRPS